MVGCAICLVHCLRFNGYSFFSLSGWMGTLDLMGTLLALSRQEDRWVVICCVDIFCAVLFDLMDTPDLMGTLVDLMGTLDLFALIFLFVEIVEYSGFDGYSYFSFVRFDGYSGLDGYLEL